MIPIKRIEFRQVEGSVDSRLHIFTDFASADIFVRGAAIDAPSDGSYYKCDVLVTWADTVNWKFQLDLTSTTPSLSHELRLDLIFFSGGCSPDDLAKRPAYLASLDENYPGMRERAAKLLITCELGQL